MKIDLEEVLAKVEATLKEKINPKIQAINLEKTDFALKTIDDKAYVFQSLDDKVMNFDPFVYYGLLECPTTAQSMALAKSPKIEVTIVLADSQDKNIHRKVLRYQRVLEEIWLDHVYPIKGIQEKVKISSLEPVSFKLQNTTTLFKAIGVIIELDLFS